jgi:hypothetical protein
MRQVVQASAVGELISVWHTEVTSVAAHPLDPVEPPPPLPPEPPVPELGTQASVPLHAGRDPAEGQTL